MIPEMGPETHTGREQGGRGSGAPSAGWGGEFQTIHCKVVLNFMFNVQQNSCTSVKISGGSHLNGMEGRGNIREGKERSPPGYFVQGPPVTPLIREQINCIHGRLSVPLSRRRTWTTIVHELGDAEIRLLRPT